MSQPGPASQAFDRVSVRVFQTEADDESTNISVPRLTDMSAEMDLRRSVSRHDSRVPAPFMDEPVLPPIFPTYHQRTRAPSLPGVKELLGSNMPLRLQAHMPSRRLQPSSDVTPVGVGLERYSLGDRRGREGTEVAEKRTVPSSPIYASGPPLSPIGSSTTIFHDRDPRVSAVESAGSSPIQPRARSWPSSGLYQVYASSPDHVDSCVSPSRSAWNARLQGVKIIPGYGDYFVYDDGSFIPTQVDGQKVNPDWGLTKQQKARKRLPKACARCHKKKQRCEPLEGGCMQCKKVMKPCDLTCCSR